MQKVVSAIMLCVLCVCLVSSPIVASPGHDETSNQTHDETTTDTRTIDGEFTETDSDSVDNAVDTAVDLLFILIESVIAFSEALAERTSQIIEATS